MIRLFYAPGTCALASHLALEQAGARYEAQRMDFGAAEQRSPAFLAINPKARVPALATDRGVLTETPAILAWIAQTHPQAGLAPVDDPFEFARLQAFNSYLCATVHVAHAHGRRAARWADDPAAQAAMQRKVPQTMGECFALIEEHLFAGPWTMGERYSVADAYLFTVASWLPSDGVDIARFPKVADHHRRMLADPVVQRVLALYALPPAK